MLYLEKFVPTLLQKMLDYLKEKRDAGFFKSLSGLMQSCRCCALGLDFTQYRSVRNREPMDVSGDA